MALTKHQRDSVESFRGIANVTEQDAIRILEEIDWDLHRAVDRFLSGHIQTGWTDLSKPKKKSTKGQYGNRRKQPVKQTTRDTTVRRKPIVQKPAAKPAPKPTPKSTTKPSSWVKTEQKPQPAPVEKVEQFEKPPVVEPSEEFTPVEQPAPQAQIEEPVQTEQVAQPVQTEQPAPVAAAQTTQTQPTPQAAQYQQMMWSNMVPSNWFYPPNYPGVQTQGGQRPEGEQPREQQQPAYGVYPQDGQHVPQQGYAPSEGYPQFNTYGNYPMYPMQQNYGNPQVYQHPMQPNMGFGGYAAPQQDDRSAPQDQYNRQAGMSGGAYPQK